MRTYNLTVFEKDGKKILDDTFTAANDEEAKIIGDFTIRKKQLSQSYPPLCNLRWEINFISPMIRINLYK